ncbi:MAG TPA: hypothetical protein VFE46_14550 [Pirellulales bacterium]|nr:hypothetical protein [Pirellulales bacterium]
MTRKSNIRRPLLVENLEPRALLCGSSSASSVLSSLAHNMLVANTHTSSVAATSTKVTGGSAAATTASFLAATLTNSSGEIVGTASFETDTNGDTTKETLIISVVGAAASASYAVTIGGDDVGTLNTDADGDGRLVLNTSSSTGTTTSSAVAANSSSKCGGDTTTGTLPAGFTLAAGAAINLASTDTTVDPLNGTFATSTGLIGEGSGFGGDGDHGGCSGHDATVSRLTTTLTDSSTSATDGKAIFTTITHSDGTSDEILRVHLTGVDVSTTFAVSIDGTSVGSITTDANGNGKLILSSNPKTSNVGQLPSGITSPTNITITSTTTSTTINGTFSAPSSTTSSSLAFVSRILARRR